MFPKPFVLLVLAVALTVSTSNGLRFRNEHFATDEPAVLKCSDGAAALIECDAQTALCTVDPSLGCESIRRKLYCCGKGVNEPTERSMR